MEKEKVEKWLQQNEDEIGIDFKGVKISASGESNHNFVIDSTEKLVLRVTKDISRKSRLMNESKVLEFLESQNIGKVPRKIYFKESTELGEVLIESFVGNEKVDTEDLTENRVRNLAKKVAEIHSIPLEDYEDFSEEEVNEKRSLNSIFKEDFKKWSKRPYEEYKELCSNPDEQIKDFYEDQEDLLSRIPDKQVRQGLCHGDLGFNIRASGDQIYIIDWEFSRINHPDIEILYCFEHLEMSQEQREIFLEEYRKVRNTGEEFELLREIYPRFLAFNDMIWAAKRTEEGENKEELLKAKIKELKEYSV